MGLSYYGQGTAGLGWPDGSLGKALGGGSALEGSALEDSALAGAVDGFGGLGWPGDGRGSRGVQVNDEVPEARGSALGTAGGPGASGTLGGDSQHGDIALLRKGTSRSIRAVQPAKLALARDA